MGRILLVLGILLIFYNFTIYGTTGQLGPATPFTVMLQEKYGVSLLSSYYTGKVLGSPFLFLGICLLACGVTWSIGANVQKRSQDK